MGKLYLIPNGKNGQAWGMDLMVAVTIFTFALLSFYLYSLNTPAGIEETIESLSYDGRGITNNLLSEGSPENWDENNVLEIGILRDGKINDTKLENFYNWVNSPGGYDETKRVFNTNFDYYFFLDENMTINSVEIDGVGKPGVTRDNAMNNAANLIKISRVTVYQNKPMGAKLYIWG